MRPRRARIWIWSDRCAATDSPGSRDRVAGPLIDWGALRPAPPEVFHRGSASARAPPRASQTPFMAAPKVGRLTAVSSVVVALLAGRNRTRGKVLIKVDSGGRERDLCLQGHRWNRRICAGCLRPNYP